MEPVSLIVPNRSITGMSAILLPFLDANTIDWQGFDAHLRKTLDVGLIPAVNMDTGYANLIDEPTRAAVLERTQALTEGKQYVAGVFVADDPGASFNADGYRHGIEQIQSHGGTPIFFQSYGLTQQTDDEIVASYALLGRECEQFIFFELSTVFAPFGSIYSIETYEQLMQISNCIGAKHSSLKRQLEWDRLKLRDKVRPDFKVLTGNDLAVDMVMYGSDYLLGLSTFAPEQFALRDRYWQAGDLRFFEVNDLLQYLGQFAFRAPVPAYKHNAAQFLKLRGQIETNLTYPGAPRRPDSDIEVLADLSVRLQTLHDRSNA